MESTPEIKVASSFRNLKDIMDIQNFYGSFIPNQIQITNFKKYEDNSFNNIIKNNFVPISVCNGENTLGTEIDFNVDKNVNKELKNDSIQYTKSNNNNYKSDCEIDNRKSIIKRSDYISMINGDTNYRRNNRSGSNGSETGNKRSQQNIKVQKIYPYVGDGMNVDHRTQLKANGKGASSIIWSLRRVQGEDGRFTGKRSLCILLGLEKHGKYSGKYNLFGGHFEDYKDKSLKDTVVRELSEEYSSRILEWVDWYGSPWAFNQSHIEIGSVSSNFSILKSFRENDEMKDARWFPVDNILKSRYITSSKKYYSTDIRGKNEFEITIYAQGVVKALDNNGQIR